MGALPETSDEGRGDGNCRPILLPGEGGEIGSSLARPYMSAMSVPAAIPAAGKAIQLKASQKNGFAEKNLVL